MSLFLLGPVGPGSPHMAHARHPAPLFSPDRLPPPLHPRSCRTGTPLGLYSCTRAGPDPPPLLLLRHALPSRRPFPPFSSLPRQEAAKQFFFLAFAPIAPSCPHPSKPSTSPHHPDPDFPLLSTRVRPPLPESDRSPPPPLPSPRYGERCPLHVFPSSNPLLSFPSFAPCCRTGRGGTR
jgi:hypothetical protein